MPRPGPPQQPNEIGKARVWVTTGDQSKLLAEETQIPITEISESSLPLDVTEKLQEIEGFGGPCTLWRPET